jgi:hypothetical protein
MYGSLRPGDVLLADALFDNYFLVCELRRRGIDVVARAQYERVGSQALRDGPDGEVLLWRRPNKPHGMTGAQYRLYPEVLLMRQVTVDARDKENRAERFKVVTTILDASIDGSQIGELYERRWDGEVDIRSIKSTMKMDVLRCKTPEMVRKEVWEYVLAYNLVRTVMAQSAAAHDVTPRAISFTGAMRTLEAFQPLLARRAFGGADRARLYRDLLDAIAAHRVADRPDRYEPRVKKRRRNHYGWLTRPRAEMKRRMARRATQK